MEVINKGVFIHLIFNFWLTIVMGHLSVSCIMKNTEIQRGKIILSFCLQRAHVLFSKSSFHSVLFYLVKMWRVCNPLPCPAYRKALQVIVAKMGNCSAEAAEGIIASWDPGKFYFHILRCHFHHIQELLPFIVTLNIVITQTIPPSITIKAPSNKNLPSPSFLGPSVPCNPVKSSALSSWCFFHLLNNGPSIPQFTISTKPHQCPQLLCFSSSCLTNRHKFILSEPCVSFLETRRTAILKKNYIVELTVFPINLEWLMVLQMTCSAHFLSMTLR